MRTGLLCWGLVLSVMGATAMAGFSEPQGVPWAEWRFTGDFDPAHEILADKASDPDSLIRRNPAAAAVSISGGKVVFTQTGPADFLRVDVDDLVENGGGGYANAYTMIFDLKALKADWLPLYNTGYNNYNAADFWAAADGSVGSGTYSDPGAIPLATWVRLVVVRRLEGGTWVRDAYVNGTKVLDNLAGEGLDGNSSLYTNAQQGEGQFTILSDSDATPYAGCELDNFAFVAAAMSDEEIADLGAYRTQGIFGIAGIASEPIPADEATDVPRDTSLAWKAGESAATHDVYFGTAFDDVNDASRDNPMGVLVSQSQTDAEFVPAGIEYGQTYYWRIDEVNAAPDNTIFRGDVWSFTVEPFAYPITGVMATASTAQPGMGPENTVNGSGLDDQNRHSTELTQMWMSSRKPAWIQFEFDKIYKLDRMLVWNSNQLIETYLGFGAKNVAVEYSTDGATWAELAGVPEFAKAPGAQTYTANTTVDFLGALAKYVKLTINQTWGGVAPQTGLSEVRFFYIPVQARAPQPAVAATDIGIDTELNWRPGREAKSHEVYLGTGRDTLGLADTVAEHSYTPIALDFGTTYFWKVNEIGGAGPYEGEVWSFTTQEHAAVDDFESYNDDDHRIYDTWIDGLTSGASGSQVGYDVSPFAERKIVHGGRQSMPLMYSNSASPFYSEAERTFDSPQNWTLGGADILTLFFQGSAPAFVQTASGSILMNAVGADIWETSDQFRFAYKTLTGNGTMVARVESIINSNAWAKGGVMIRQSVEPGSTHAFMPITPGGSGGGNGASFQRRLTTGGPSTNNDSATVVAAPYWVKIERSGNNFSGSISPDGITWTQLGTAQTIPMAGPVLIGLALCSHDAAVPTGAEFSHISTTGNVSGSWQIAEIGADQPTGNSVEGLYVTIKDSSNKSRTVAHPDAAATARIGWQQWKIPLTEFTSAGVKVGAVKSMTIGVGNKASPAKGGTGRVFIDDIAFGVSRP